jgi:hypothetical protein
VGPGQLLGVGRDLTVRAIAHRIVDVEARLFFEMHAAGRDQRYPALGERLPGTDELRH